MVSACTKKPPLPPEPIEVKQSKWFEAKPDQNEEILTFDAEPQTEISRVYFPLNSTEISPVDMGIISGWAEYLRLSTRGAKIVGHACPLGEAEYNYDLGMRRAQAVKTVLVGMGIEPSRIRTISKGETEPETTNPDDYQFNRRVIMEVVK